MGTRGRKVRHGTFNTAKVGAVPTGSLRNKPGEKIMVLTPVRRPAVKASMSHGVISDTAQKVVPEIGVFERLQDLVGNAYETNNQTLDILEMKFEGAFGEDSKKKEKEKAQGQIDDLIQSLIYLNDQLSTVLQFVRRL